MSEADLRSRRYAPQSLVPDGSRVCMNTLELRVLGARHGVLLRRMGPASHRSDGRGMRRLRFGGYGYDSAFRCPVPRVRRLRSVLACKHVQKQSAAVSGTPGKTHPAFGVSERMESERCTRFSILRIFLLYSHRTRCV